MRMLLARVFGFWRTGIPRPVLVLQAGTALNYFGTGLILPFEIIYLHTVRGFPPATPGVTSICSSSVLIAMWRLRLDYGVLLQMLL